MTHVETDRPQKSATYYQIASGARLPAGCVTSRDIVSARLLSFLLLAAGRASAAESPAPAEPASWYASANFYLLEGEDDFLQPTAFVDHGRLHLEARYNYEDRDTGSIWAGYNLSAGDEFALKFTPMLGAVVGSTAGIAPGYKASLSWRRLELYSEAEYVVDTDGADDSFFYTWTELSVAPAEWWRAGLVIQRTKSYETEFEVQRGLLLGFHRGRLDFTAYVLNPDESPAYVLAVGAGF